MVLHSFLVPAQLVLDLVDADIHRRFRGRTRLARHEVMLVFGRDQDLYFPCMLDVVDRDFDRHEAGEVRLPPFLAFSGGPTRVWIQHYDPMGSWPISTVVAALPVLVLLGLLASGRAGAWQAALAGLATACLIALGVFGMPAAMVLAGAAV